MKICSPALFQCLLGLLDDVSRQRGERGPVVNGAKYEVLILQQRTGKD